jgi:polyisoprenoid-binding protein YceI
MVINPCRPVASPSPQPQPQPLPAPATPPGADVWRVDPAHTSAQFAVRHLLASTVRGQLGVVTGWVRYNPAAPGEMAAEVWIDATGISTGNAARDTHLRSDDFLLVEQHPRITFVSTRAGLGGGGRIALTGQLTIRGMTREVTLDVEAPSAPVQRAANQPVVVGTSATTVISRNAFGVKYNALIEAGGAVVSDDVRITIDIEARRAPATGRDR